jgi:citrate lyase subunit alpha/citrate CoA-transferase
MGVKDLMWFPSASFPCHEPLTKYLEDGTIHHIEGSMNGALGKVHFPWKDEGTGCAPFTWRPLPGGPGWGGAH